MLVSNKTYYNKQNLPHRMHNHVYGVRTVLEEFFAELLFPGDSAAQSRFLWASKGTAIIRRMEQLEDLKLSDDLNPLQLPYAVYYHKEGWKYDSRPAGSQMSSVMTELQWSTEQTGVRANMLAAERHYQVLTFFATEYDAEVAYDSILWVHERPHHRSYKLVVGGKEISIPVELSLVGVQIDRLTGLDDYVRQQKLVRLMVDIRARTPLLRAEPDQPPVVLAESVHWYFHNQNWRALEGDEGPQTLEEWENMSQITFAIDESTHPNATPINEDDTSDLVDLQFTTPDAREAVFTWDYLGQEPERISFLVHLGNEIQEHEIYPGDHDPSPTSYVVTGLEPSSVHDVRIVARWSSKKIRNYHYSISTPDDPAMRKGLGGLVGYTL